MIKYSRHARRKMKLYDITEPEVEKVIKEGEQIKPDDNNIEFIYNLSGKELFLQIICGKTDEGYLTITCYPLKRGVQ